MLKFISGFLTGIVSATAIILMIVLYPADTTTGQLKSVPQAQEKSPLQDILDQAASKSAQGPNCPRTDEFTRVVNDFKQELDTARDPHLLSATPLRRIYKAFNPDSIINYSGYELYGLIGKIYTDCTGLAAPEVIELEEGYLRHTCFHMPSVSNGKMTSRIVAGPEDADLIKLCEQK